MDKDVLDLELMSYVEPSCYFLSLYFLREREEFPTIPENSILEEICFMNNKSRLKRNKFKEIGVEKVC